MSDIHRVELPGLLAQSEHVARLGAGRSRPPEVVERAELDYRLELEARERDEDVLAAEEIPAIEREPRQHGDDAGQRRRRSAHGQAANDEAEDGTDEAPGRPHVDVTA